MKQEKIKPHNFCETPEEKCTMNYFDDNGCMNRKRELVQPKIERSYSEEDMKEAFNGFKSGKSFIEWFEQFKNK